MTTLPVEILQTVLAFHVASYVHEMVGPHAEITEDEKKGGKDAVIRTVARPVLPLLLTSYQFHDITLETLSTHLMIPFSGPRDRVEDNPWYRLALVRAFVLDGRLSGPLLSDPISVAHTSTTLAVYVFAKRALLELARVQCPYDLATCTMDRQQFSVARSASQDALLSIEAAFRRLPRVPPALLPPLRQHVIDVFCPVLLACRVGIPLAMLVHSFGILRQFQALDARREPGAPASLPLFLPDFRASLRLAHVQDAQILGMFTMRTRGTALDAPMILDLCAVLQRIVDNDVPECELYEECRDVARSIHDEVDALLPLIQG
ncbi:hypothetical protein PsYK624_118240 [Phanerochaete sordida]|uniref:Uncharacterized protein n=1 Tax=Phanerochaete sordida TaxID=48140 RepID=A0A9P3LI21_9APHY|nr:hypothetical protein PsYK624_118240 [Phanerochaete sordida]